MDACDLSDNLLFDGFLFDRRSDRLFRVDQLGIAEPVPLGCRSLRLLGLLLERQGELVSKDAIMKAVWPGRVVEEANLNVQISKLRHMLDLGREHGSCIQTVSGYGYRFVAGVSRTEAATRSRSPTIPQNDTTLRPRLSIVVLPFANLSGDHEQQYFADGIAADLATDLSRIEDMFVISRNTAFTYRNNAIDTKQIGRELGVRYVLEGSVRRLSDHIRVNAQLINAETDAQLWAERFDGEVGDMFDLQNEITSRIAVALNLELVVAETQRPTNDPDALDYILRGRAAILSKPAAPANRKAAISLFEHALALDPRSTGAQSWLATALMHSQPDENSDLAVSDISRAETLSGQAVTSSPKSSTAHYARGQVLRARQRLEDAMAEYDTVIALNRNWVAAMGELGWCKLVTGSAGEAIRLHQQAIRLSPRDPLIGIWYGQVGLSYLLQSRIDDAILWLEKGRLANPEAPSLHSRLASAYALNGELDRAEAELDETRKTGVDTRYSSIGRLRATVAFLKPRIRDAIESTYFAGLRMAGIPEE
jgi:TolB-like protein/Tfp pilus assembly protein PilF